MNIWQTRIPGAHFLDLFAGSGAVGIEALSRSAHQVTLVERNRVVLTALEAIRNSIDAERLEIIQADLPLDLAKLGRQYDDRFDLVFADPPYDYAAYSEIIEGVEPLLASGGEVAIEHEAGLMLPAEHVTMGQFDRRVYGDSAISFYSCRSE